MKTKKNTKLLKHTMDRSNYYYLIWRNATNFIWTEDGSNITSWLSFFLTFFYCLCRHHVLSIHDCEFFKAKMIEDQRSFTGILKWSGKSFWQKMKRRRRWGRRLRRKRGRRRLGRTRGRRRRGATHRRRKPKMKSKKRLDSGFENHQSCKCVI